MNILHCCLANFYIDNYGYQENILPRMHKLQGHNVLILASTETFINNKELGYIKEGKYINSDGIPVHRLPYASWLPHKIMTKLRYYKGVYDELEHFRPDIIFVHDVQFMDVRQIVRYVKKHPKTKVFVDGHADFNNSARGFVSKHILHGLIYRSCAQKVEPYTKRFYGTLPARVSFFNQMYKIPSEKIELLVMGADDGLVERALKEDVRQSLRKRFNVGDNDFLIVSGGKIDLNKPEILNLMRAVNEIGRSNLKLLIFGSVTKELEKEFNRLCDEKFVKMAGWVSEAQTYEYMGAADLVVFPGLHSVLWEQAVGLGKPCLFRKIDGFTHIDLGGNCRFLIKCTVDEIKAEIFKCLESYPRMEAIAKANASKFSYSKIARKAIS